MQCISKVEKDEGVTDCTRSDWNQVIQLILVYPSQNKRKKKITKMDFEDRLKSYQAYQQNFAPSLACTSRKQQRLFLPSCWKPPDHCQEEECKTFPGAAPDVSATFHLPAVKTVWKFQSPAELI
ncbi:unnamed protein product [Lepidochelys kempii]